MAFLYREYVEFVPCVAQLFRIFARGKSDVIFRYLILGFDLASTWLRYGFDMASPRTYLPASRHARTTDCFTLCLPDSTAPLFRKHSVQQFKDFSIMAQVNFPSDIQSISGKLCSEDGIVYSVNKQTGKTYRSDRHGYNDANTEAQQQVRKLFVTKGRFAVKWWKANKPSAENPKGTDSYKLVMKAYKAQHKIGNSYSYLRSLVTDDLKVKLGDLDITGEIKADAPSSGTGSKPSGSQTPSGGSQGAGSKPSGSQTTGGGTSQGAGGADGKDEG